MTTKPVVSLTSLRSIDNHLYFFPVSTQVKLIWVGETAVAVNLIEVDWQNS